MSITAGPGDATQVGGGLRLGKYMLDAPLGAGGMAEVFRAHTLGAEGFSRPVAIKRVLPDASKNPAFSEMFISEAKLSSRLQHPNIVNVLDFDRDHEGRLYLVMELVEGRDLDALIDSGRLPFSALVYVLVEVLRGLGYAHDLPVTADGVRGLVHRDVSPHNVLLSWAGAVKVSDFGIAKARAATAASASVTIKGKPAYMSPEQINGSPLDGRSDLFAVGVMMWQMLTGQYLFAAGTTSETLARVLFAPVPSPRSVAPDVPPDLEAVTMRLLAKEPGQRYASAEDAIDELLRCRDAPRDGRRELEQLLVTRFPHKAPVRTGQRSRGAVPDGPDALPAGTPPQMPPYGSPHGTVPLGPPHGTVPLGPAHAATTHTAPASPAAMAASAGASRRGVLVASGAIAAVVLAVAVLVIVSAGGSQPSAPGEAAGAGGPVDAGAGAALAGEAADAATPDTTPDAMSDATPVAESVPGADAAVPPVDAAPPTDARRRGGDGKGTGRGSGQGTGQGSGKGTGSIHEIKIP
ncbi:MAG: serine/threonine protein kinase [Myxococcales bacterium]|nr:serine/threonine protein kinase [Myxococcales bacterium]